MTRVSDSNIYDFDVAVSFAGDDHELAEEVVNQLRVAGLTVFCDTDRMPSIWGGELLEDLDQVYCSRARSVLIFVSYPYSKRMWAQHQRRRALACALKQDTSRVLLARLDSTRLKGLRPATGYLDARRIGLGGVAQAAIANLTGIQVPTSAIDHVPRTEIERQQMLQVRPLGWEYLYFAGQLRHERDSIEAKYRDHEMRYGRPAGIEVSHGDIGGYLARAGQEASHISQTLTQLMGQEAQIRAFGAPGQPGDLDAVPPGQTLEQRLRTVHRLGGRCSWGKSLARIPPRVGAACPLRGRTNRVLPGFCRQPRHDGRQAPCRRRHR